MYNDELPKNFIGMYITETVGVSILACMADYMYVCMYVCMYDYMYWCMRCPSFLASLLCLCVYLFCEQLH